VAAIHTTYASPVALLMPAAVASWLHCAWYMATLPRFPGKVFDVANTRFAGSREKVAVVVRLAFMTSEQTRFGPLALHWPAHPDSTDVTVEPVLVGLAVSTTEVPLSKVAVHAVGAVQVVPPGWMTTVPAPLPANDSVSV
jgi:hypothetical protein